MERKEFIKKTAATFIALNSLSVFDLFSANFFLTKDKIELSGLNNIDTNLLKSFQELVTWLKEKKWEEFLLNNTNLTSIAWDDQAKLCEVLTGIIRLKRNGFDDFGGNKFIEPGNPSLSLLYHALASPRVKDTIILEYPSIEQLDILENFIYGLKKWDDYLKNVNKDNLHFMVLAYEYRPAYKTPALGVNDFEKKFPKYSQLVFSRTGISRIGNHEMNYDSVSRSYSNQPSDPNREKEIAVTPARFGLFLVELTEITKDESDKIKVMNIQVNEYTKYKGSREHLNRNFINPVRKIFEDETFTIKYAQYHLNQKLYRFSQFELHGKKMEEINKDSNWNVHTYPFRRVDCIDENGTRLLRNSNDKQLVKLTRNGSTVLLSSVPDDLIRIAEQYTNQLSFYVEPKWERRYNALKLNNKSNTDTYDSFITEFIYRRNRATSKFRAMRNSPLFVNIKYQVNNSAVSHLDERNADMEDIIKNGGYKALLFEDSMCDGCVAADITINKGKESVLFDLIKSNNRIHAAVSLVAAPDFFPYLDSNDIRKYYHPDIDNHLGEDKNKTILPFKARPAQEQQEKQQQLDNVSIPNDEHFVEGGSLNLSGVRQRGNPEIINPFTNRQAFFDIYDDDKSFDTLLAVVAPSDTLPFPVSADDSLRFRDNFRRKYTANSFLPDTGTGIFFPGWDATYSGDKINPYIASFGLGSPFPEDMKLCAAANGMWPVASPDAGRTFQGSLKPFPIIGRPNTSIPLMDDEIGFHPDSPHVKHHGQLSIFGWDGEHGPYLMIDSKDNKPKVNFTDIGRADYVANILDKNIGFNMSRLRQINPFELTNRMDCIRKAIKSIDHDKKVSQTKFWLISAEKVDDWSVGANAYGVPDNLIGSSNAWAKTSGKLNGEGYLFVFAKTKMGKIDNELEHKNSKRRNQAVKELCICKVAIASEDNYADIEWCRLKIPLPKASSGIKWLPENK